MNIVESYNNLPPSKKRMVMVGGGVCVILALSFVFSNSVDNTKRSMRTEKPEVNVVGASRVSGFEEFSSQLVTLRREMDNLRRELEEEKRKNEKEKEKRQKDEQFSPLSLDSGDGDDFSSVLSEVEDSVVESAFNNVDVIEPIIPTINMPPPLPTVTPPPVAAAESSEWEQTSQAAVEEKPVRPPMEIRVLGNLQSQEQIAAEEAREAAAKEQVFIPSGSMFTGVLLNGLDAPTSGAAQQNPTPVIIRIKREAILPNFASIDVRECFALAAGFGQLSSERAILRTENLSCVRTDGQVFETKLEAYIVGSDGKVGVPGRLVSKQGQMIAQSLMAGVFSGIGSALDRARSPTLNLDPSNPVYEKNSVETVFQSGIAGGFSSAANMVAKFYLDMAKEAFPVVEVQAGEVGTIIVTRGGNLPLKGSTSLQEYSEGARPATVARTNAWAGQGNPTQAASPQQANVAAWSNSNPTGQSPAPAGDLEAVRAAMANQNPQNGFASGVGW